MVLEYPLQSFLTPKHFAHLNKRLSKGIRRRVLFCYTVAKNNPKVNPCTGRHTRFPCYHKLTHVWVIYGNKELLWNIQIYMYAASGTCAASVV